MRRARRSYSGYEYGYWPKTATVAERRSSAERETAKIAKKGETLCPVRIQGRTIAQTFWGKAWCTNLERYSDYSNRLPRGRSYLSSGQVLDLRVAKGKVVARVMGTRLYTVTVSIDPVADRRWTEIVRSCSGQVGSMIELLQGKLSQSVMETVTRPGTGLFPAPTEIHLQCSCPDWASMCKHVAASLYGVGARLDTSPELLFVLRGVEATELVVDSGAARAITGQARDKALGADTAELADLFGIDMGGAVTQPKAATVEMTQSPGASDDGPVTVQPKSGVRRRKTSSAEVEVPAQPVTPKTEPAKKPPRPKTARAASSPAETPRPSRKRAPLVSAGTLVTQKELDGRDIGGPAVDYWVSAGLLLPGSEEGTWIATPEAMRRIERFPKKLPRKRRK